MTAGAAARVPKKIPGKKRQAGTMGKKGKVGMLYAVAEHSLSGIRRLRETGYNRAWSGLR